MAVRTPPPITPGLSSEMVGHLTGHDRLSGEVHGQITRVAGGNPLFLQEIFGITRSTQILIDPDSTQTVDIEIRLGPDWAASLPAE